MRPIQDWLDEYGESHRNPTNKLIHWICVPLIVLSLVGLLWSLPVPETFSDISPALNWGTMFVMAAIVYYFIMSFSLALGMMVVIPLMLLAIHWLDVSFAAPLWAICVGIFVAAWIGQFIGHHIEGKRPSFLTDVQFLMIGPIWLLSFLYKRLGIPY